jgi:hypothetical protein
VLLEQVFGAEDVEPLNSPGSTTTQLSQAPLEHVDFDRGACEETRTEGQFSEHTQGDTCAHSSGGTKLGGIGKHNNSTGHGVQCFVFSMGHGGPGLHKTWDGYYYDVEGVRYRRSGEEGQYTYEEVALVFEADKDRVSSPIVDAWFSNAIDYVTADTSSGWPTPLELQLLYDCGTPPHKGHDEVPT